jgi:hypothetical protein
MAMYYQILSRHQPEDLNAQIQGSSRNLTTPTKHSSDNTSFTRKLCTFDSTTDRRLNLTNNGYMSESTKNAKKEFSMLKEDAENYEWGKYHSLTKSKQLPLLLTLSPFN